MVFFPEDMGVMLGASVSCLIVAAFMLWVVWKNYSDRP